MQVGDGGVEDVTETIPIIHLRCRFGGSRAYFICPGPRNGTDCGRRITKLSCRSAIFCADTAISSPTRASSNNRCTGHLGGPTKTGSALVSVSGLPSRFPISPGGCGHALTASYSMKYYRP